MRCAGRARRRPHDAPANEDFRQGLPQCIAEMYAARIFNERRARCRSPTVLARCNGGWGGVDCAATGRRLTLTMKLTHNLTMIRVNVAEAKAHLSEYLDKLEGGQMDVVVLCRRNEPIAEIRPLPRAEGRPRPVGRAKETFRVPRTFFDPLPDDLVAAFAGGT